MYTSSLTVFKLLSRGKTMYFLLLFLIIFVIILIFVLLISSVYNLFMLVLTEKSFRDKTMNTQPCSNHQIRVLTLEDNHFKDETLYVLKKGTYFFTYILIVDIGIINLFLLPTYYLFLLNRVVFRVPVGSFTLWKWC